MLLIPMLLPILIIKSGNHFTLGSPTAHREAETAKAHRG